MTRKAATTTTPAKTVRAAKAKAVKRKEYVLRLYVAGLSPRSRSAIENITSICEEYLHGRYDLEVIDVFKRPVLAREEQIVATPTLVKRLPAPLRRSGPGRQGRHRPCAW